MIFYLFIYFVIYFICITPNPKVKVTSNFNLRLKIFIGEKWKIKPKYVKSNSFFKKTRKDGSSVLTHPISNNFLFLR